jgi:HemK-related putative methylase
VSAESPLNGAALVAAAPQGVLRAAIGKLLWWRFKFLQSKRHRQVVLERLPDFPLLVFPSVLNPRLMRSGAFFAACLSGDLIPNGAEVLDMGTGSGICAIASARRARHVVAVDINPAAVRCARANALMNSLEQRIEITQGDLYAPIAGRRFDVVLFNPPYVRAAPRDDADRALRSLDVAERFAEGLAAALQPTGFALVLLSTYGDAEKFVGELQRQNFTVRSVAQRSYINEKLFLLRVEPAQPVVRAGGSG